ncbi:sensor histidine kinase [Galbibacter orientalis]
MNKNRKKVGLIQKTSNIFIMVSLLLMSLSSIALYFYLRNILEVEIEEQLYSTAARIESSLEAGKNPYSLPPAVEVATSNKSLPDILKDTLIYDPSQDEIELFRELSSFKKINNINYKITVRDLVVESENILMAIIISYLLIIITVFVVLYYFNKVGNSYLWKPFFNTLEQIKEFSLSTKEPVALSISNIREFSELNTQVKILTDKVRGDYNNLKQFTEDVSHELQTPLAIMQVKIESVINDAPLSNQQYDQLTSIQKDIKRVTQMNKGLTLLTKIENNQFINPKQVSLTSIVEGNIANFKEIFQQDIQFVNENELLVTMDYHLAEILCNNLISNAIKHHIGSGDIVIEITKEHLSVCNKGEKPILHADRIFNRFYKENESVKSTGLGLAIAKKICDMYNFKLTYTFEKGFHIFLVQFS